MPSHADTTVLEVSLNKKALYNIPGTVSTWIYALMDIC